MNFFKFKEFEKYWGAAFLKICLQIWIFLNSNWSCEFGQAESGNGEQKESTFAALNFFTLSK